MKKQLVFLGLLGLTLTACENSTSRAPDADNTERNVRDRSGQTYTPGDQSESAADRTISQDIRRLLMDDASLSTNAKNVKIISVNGSVVLRGPVANEKEKALIATKARQVTGVKNVDDQLEITADSNK